MENACLRLACLIPLAAQVADIATTAVGLRLGMREVNPVLRRLGWLPTTALKVGYGLAAACALASPALGSLGTGAWLVLFVCCTVPTGAAATSNVLLIAWAVLRRRWRRR